MKASVTTIGLLVLSLFVPSAVRADPWGGNVPGQVPCSQDKYCRLNPLWASHKNVFFRCNKPGLVAMTFDDGPDKPQTGQIVDELDQLGVKGTFFVNGINAASDGNDFFGERRELMKKAARSGHQIACHTYGHTSLTGTGISELGRNEREVNAVLASVGAEMTRYLRPPFLNLNQDAADEVERLGYKVVQINMDTDDWRGRSKADMLADFQALSKDSTTHSYITLQHDKHYKAGLVTETVQWFQDKGYKIVTVAECLGGEAPPLRPTPPPVPTAPTPRPTPGASSNRCGADWTDANDRCGTDCPRGTDAECPAGEKCFADMQKTCGGGGGQQPTPSPRPTKSPRCGADWTDANDRCGTDCPSGTDNECPAGEKCFADMQKTCGGGGGQQPTSPPVRTPTSRPTQVDGKLTHAKWTYYWMKFQKPSDMVSPDTVLRTCQGEAIVTVDRQYAEKVRMEGSAYLIDGTLINLGGCDCGAGFSCFMRVDASSAPWGLGAWDSANQRSLSLDPYVSIASNDHALGTTLFVPALKGVELPDIRRGKRNRRVHNGCVRVDDVSWSFGSGHLDWFVARKANYKILIEKVGQDQTIEYREQTCQPLEYHVTPRSARDHGQTTDKKDTAAPIAAPTKAPTGRPTKRTRTEKPTTAPETGACDRITRKRKCRRASAKHGCIWNDGSCEAPDTEITCEGLKRRMCKQNRQTCRWRRPSSGGRKQCLEA